FHEDEEAAEEATERVKEAQKKVTRTVKERDSESSVATAKDVREAKAKNGVATNDAPPKMMRASKVQNALQYFDALIENDGACLEDPPTFVADVNDLKLIRRILNNNILANDENFAATIKRHIDAKQ